MSPEMALALIKVYTCTCTCVCVCVCVHVCERERERERERRLERDRETPPPPPSLSLAQECRSAGVECIVAPYEADSQLAYLCKEEIVDFVITEDSDLLVFGCGKVRQLEFMYVMWCVCVCVCVCCVCGL